MSNQDYINKYITKKFNTRAKGYDPYEVDVFFDELIKKIKTLETLNDELTTKNNNLDNEILSLTQTINEKDAIIVGKEKQIEELHKSGFHNEAMMRRIKKLEEDAAKNPHASRKEEGQ